MKANFIFKSIAVTSILLIAIYIMILKNRQPLPVLGELSAFELINAQGEVFASNRLQNRVWVANFIFTTCQGICPLLSREMVSLQKRFKAKDFDLVSISVDPENDRPEQLRAFAERFTAKTDNWHFLTGEKSVIKNVLEKKFKIGFSENPLEHSDRFVLIDQKFKIRGYYSLADREAMAKLATDTARLLR